MRKKILVVDDDPAALSGMLELVRDAGYEADGAGSFEGAKRLLLEESPNLLIVDLRLGPFNGLHLVLRERLAHPERPVIVTTGFPDSVLEAEATRHGAAYVIKPINPERLLDMMSRMLAESDRVGTSPVLRG